jgi:signal transduction histidine kinase
MEGWHALRHALWPHHRPEELRPEMPAMLDDPEGLVLLAAAADGMLLGMAEACVRRDYVNGCQTSPVGFLEGWYVLPAARGRGIGRGLVAATEDWAAPLARTRGLTATFVVDASVPLTAVGDCRRISQVVTNLVDNAITFTERGGVDVRVSAPDVGQDTESASWLELEVRDTGIGISPDQLPALMAPFRQADPHAGDRRGLGLGLAISNELVALMGGRLTATSAPGEGSTFTVALPLGRDEATSPL